MNEAYSTLAEYYDRLMGDFDYHGYVAFVDARLGKVGADLCCGTGRFTRELAARGRRVVGVDNSPQMLNVARDAARKSGLRIEWVAEDVSRFCPQGELDFVTCVCDGFNYLPPDKLAQTLHRIAGYVKAGGTLAFDVSTAYKLEHVLGDNFFCEDYDDLTYIWNNAYDRAHACVRMQLAFFRPEGDMYRRSDEEHVQYAHTHEHIMQALEPDWTCEVWDGERYAPYTSHTKRALYICRRKAFV